MSSVSINGFGDDLCINDVRIGDLTPDDHEKIEKEKGGQNYAPLENVVISKVKDSSTLIARKPHPEDVSKYIEEEILDGLCCYSAVNQGQLNQTIVNAVIKHLQEEKLPTVPRSIRHKYMSAFLLAATSITGMDRVIPKVAGVESWELSFKICRRWGYEVKGIPKNKAIVVGATGNFHGRSLAAVSFSDDPDSKENFGPFVPGIELVPYNDIDALEDLFEKKGDYIAAYMVEPIQGEAGVIVPDDNYFIKVFKKSKSIWKDSDGYFDPTIGLLTNAYGLGPNKIPNYSINIDSLLNYTGFEKVNLVNNQIQMKNGMFLDFNAIAKGYAVDLISEILIENGVNNFLIDIGGEMYANEINNVKNTNWRVGITDPLNPDKKNNRIFLENKAIASSGNYRKFLIDPRTGDKIVHTINPKNGNANQTNILSTSVIADDCMTADGYSTAFMAMPLELSKMVVQSKPEIEAMIIYVDEKNEVKTFYSPGFEKLLF